MMTRRFRFLPRSLLVVFFASQLLTFCCADWGDPSPEISWSSVETDNDEQNGATVNKEPSLPNKHGRSCPAGYYRAEPLIWSCNNDPYDLFEDGFRLAAPSSGHFQAFEVPKGAKDVKLLVWNDQGLALKIGTPSDPNMIAATGLNVNAQHGSGYLHGPQVSATLSGHPGREHVTLDGTLAEPLTAYLDGQVSGHSDVRATVLVQYENAPGCAPSDAGGDELDEEDEPVPSGCQAYDEGVAQKALKNWCCSGKWTADEAWKLVGLMHAEVHGEEAVIPWYLFGKMWDSYRASAGQEDSWKAAFKYMDTDDNMVVNKEEFTSVFSLCPAVMEEASAFPTWVKILLILLAAACMLGLAACAFVVVAATRRESAEAYTGAEGGQGRALAWSEQHKPLVKSRHDIEAALWAANREAKQNYPIEKVQKSVQDTVGAPSPERTCGVAPKNHWLTQYFDCGGRTKAAPPAAAAAAAPTLPPAATQMYNSIMGRLPQMAPAQVEEPPPPQETDELLTDIQGFGQNGLRVSTNGETPDYVYIATDELLDVQASQASERELEAASQKLLSALAAADGNITEATRRHALKAVEQVMRDNVANPKLQETFCWCEASLCKDAPGDLPDSAASMAVSLGAVAAIVAAMQQHPDDMSVQKAAIQAVRMLVFCEDGRNMICKWSGPKLIMATMRSHMNDVDLQESACIALGNISLAEGAVTHLDGEILETVIAVMKKHPLEEGVQSAGITALYNIDYQLSDDALFNSLGVRRVVQQAIINHQHLEDEEEARCLLQED
mmetsp:Transcript_84538/g.185616  ORF Transcript_84538/g.185616 Transcript_84538/m.185616 type:complete len:781 (+) Transcript_84538:229-2571(+)